MTDVERFCEAARAEGLDLTPETIVIDGPLANRCALIGEHGKKSGAYHLYGDGMLAGWLQNHKGGEIKTWCSRTKNESPRAEWNAIRARITADQKKRAEELAQARAEAATLAREIWNESTPCSTHPYLTLKRVQSHGLRTTTRDRELVCSDGEKTMPVPAGVLIVPLCGSDGELHTLEFIWGSEKKKRFLPGGQTGGHFYVLGDPATSQAICIAEGYATCATIFQATGYATVIAFDCENLESVARTFRKEFPDVRIVICADDDHLTKGNPGIRHGTKSAQAINAVLAVPDFGDGRPEGATDFNDLADAKGLDEVSAQINAVLADSPPAVDAEPVTADAPGEPVPLDDSDADHAARLWRDLKGSCHYIAERKTFAFYQPQRGVWEYDETGSRVLASTEKITAQLLEEARWYCDAASDCTDDKASEKFKVRAKALQDEALQSKGLRFKKAAIELLRAQPECEASSSIFDARDDLMNFRNGTLELETGKFREQRREDHLMAMIQRDFRQGATAPRWERFVNEVWTDPGTRLLLKAWAGYSLSTSVKEQVFLYLWGIGANGKSIFARVLEALLGPYAVQCGIDMFIANDDAKANRETINLKGKRLAICSETEEGRRLNEVLIKSVVSPDKQVGRRLYCEVETWEPTAKVMILGNHLMRTRGGSHATDRRIRLVGCEQVFEGEQCDPGLLDKLIAELDGITVWAIDGYKQWKASGLPLPAKVKADTDEYTAANDTLRPFFEDMCVSDRARETGRRKLYATYIEWARAQGEQHPLSPKTFAARVQDRGFRAGPQKRIGRETDRVWLGIGLAADSPSQLSPVTGKLFPIHPARDGLSGIGVTSASPVTEPVFDDGVLT
jgi:P4 family phage/plasmid primase-like protien